MGRHLNPLYSQVILVSGYPVLTAVNWSQRWCAICVQYQFSCAPKLARKCETNVYWFPCGMDGRAGRRAVYVHVITKFLGWVDLLSYGALLAHASRAWSSAIKQWTKNVIPTIMETIKDSTWPLHRPIKCEFRDRRRNREFYSCIYRCYMNNIACSGCIQLKNSNNNRKHESLHRTRLQKKSFKVHEAQRQTVTQHLTVC